MIKIYDISKNIHELLIFYFKYIFFLSCTYSVVTLNSFLVYKLLLSYFNKLLFTIWIIQIKYSYENFILYNLILVFTLLYIFKAYFYLLKSNDGN